MHSKVPPCGSRPGTQRRERDPWVLDALGKAGI